MPVMEEDQGKPIKPTIYRWLWISLGLVLIIQVVGVMVLDPLAYRDSPEYLSIAKSIYHRQGYAITGAPFEGFDTFQGESPTRMRQPLYPLYLVLFYWCLGKSALAVQVSQIVLNLLTFYLLFLIAYRVFREKLWAGTLIGLALYFPIWFTSSFILTEALFTFLLVLYLFFLQKALYGSGNISNFAISGAVLGLVVLTRPIGVLLCFLSFFLLWIYLGFGKAWLRWITTLGALLVVLFPWFLRNAIVLGDYTPLSSDGGYGFWVGSLAEREPIWSDSPQFRSAVGEGFYHDRQANRKFTELAIRNIKSDPVGYIVRTVKRVVWTWSYLPGSYQHRENAFVFGASRLIQVFILFCAIYAAIATLGAKTATYYLFPAVALSSALLFHFGYSRLILPAMPWVVVLAGQGFRHLTQRLTNTISSRVV
jgi:4-amino-4-deoxy-L-arabinose transferase-like glycosyltransferase